MEACRMSGILQHLKGMPEVEIDRPLSARAGRTLSGD
jgi:hypothetical protein